MKELSAKKCVPCEGGVAPMTAGKAKLMRKQLHGDWRVAKDSKSLKRSLKFKDFYRTMSFGYNYCDVTFSTHSIDGLSENDFICAAKLDRL
jgi:4a-hydroxytetrahydrobiopterin dehydratase